MLLLDLLFLSPPQLLLIVPLVASFSMGPNVAPLSLLTPITGSLFPSLGVSHHDTYTLFPSVTRSALSERVLGLLLRLIVDPTVLPLSVLFAKNTSQFPVFYPMKAHIHYYQMLLCEYSLLNPATYPIQV